MPLEESDSSSAKGKAWLYCRTFIPDFIEDGFAYAHVNGSAGIWAKMQVLTLGSQNDLNAASSHDFVLGKVAGPEGYRSSRCPVRRLLPRSQS